MFYQTEHNFLRSVEPKVYGVTTNIDWIFYKTKCYFKPTLMSIPKEEKPLKTELFCRKISKPVFEVIEEFYQDYSQ